MYLFFLLGCCILFAIAFTVINLEFKKTKQELDVKSEIISELGAPFISNTIKMYHLRHNPNSSMVEMDRLIAKENELVEQYLDRIESARNSSDPSKSFTVNFLHQFK